MEKKRLTKSGAENYVRRLIQDSRTKKGKKLTNLNMYMAFINSKQWKLPGRGVARLGSCKNGVLHSAQD